MLQYGEYRANVQYLKLFLQLPNDADASHSKCPLQFTNVTALMQINIEICSSVGTKAKHMYNTVLPGHDGTKCQITHQNMPNSFRKMPNSLMAVTF